MFTICVILGLIDSMELWVLVVMIIEMFTLFLISVILLKKACFKLGKNIARAKHQMLGETVSEDQIELEGAIIGAGLMIANNIRMNRNLNK